MRTRHEHLTSYQFGDAIKCALHEVKSYDNNLRIVNCGRGVVILPDTNRKADCTEGELIKALGLVKKYDGLHLEGNPIEKRAQGEQVLIWCDDDKPEQLLLTPDQLRLLTWLENNGYLYENIDIQVVKPTELKEI